jgi:hypothetical protein
MEAVHGLARQMQPPDPISPREATLADTPFLQNLLPWPDTPSLTRDDLERLASTLQVKEAGLPAGLVEYDRVRSEPRNGEPLRIPPRACINASPSSTDESCHVRVCIGGRTRRVARAVPGVIERGVDRIACKESQVIGRLTRGRDATTYRRCCWTADAR